MVRRTVTLPRDLDAQLQAAATADTRPVSSMLQVLLRYGLAAWRDLTPPGSSRPTLGP